ncbi:MAG TPA: hypothetical protein VIR26_03560 [Metalysinibacillus sp.]
MERCEYCGTPFIKGESCDIGVGFMQVTADEPNCECYEETECTLCFLPLTKGELKEHYECWDERWVEEEGDE